MSSCGSCAVSGSVYLKLHEDYNIFDKESGVNLLI